MKRLFDIVGGGLALILFGPLILACAIWVRLDSPGPAFYRQTRVGLGCQTFGMLKLRTMVQDADRIGGYATAQGDPRITRAGRTLRRTSLDELPQLWNVLIGDMSLVGPRPDVPAQEKLYAPQDWKERCSVRPGITGPAQATLRSAATPEQRLALDLDYARNPSVLRDLRIIGQTVAAVFSARGTN